MALEALLVSRDSDAVSILQTVMRDLKIEAQVCPDLQPAVERLAQGRSAIVVVDYDVEHATELLKLVRQNYAGSCVALAMVKGLPSIQAAYELGANFVMIKPIILESASRSLTEAASLVSRMVARRERLAVPTLAYANFEGSRDPAIILDLGEGGMAVQALQPIDAKGPLRVHFDLPGSLDSIDVGCEIIWADSTGRAGLRFTDISEDARRALQAWLAMNGVPRQTPVQEKPKPAPTPAVVAVLSPAGRTKPISVAQRIFAALVDGIVVLLACAVFAVIVWAWARHLPASVWALPVGLTVPFVFTVLYLYVFLAHPRGTPGMQMAEKGSRAAEAPEMFSLIPAPPLVAMSSRVLGWLEAHGKDPAGDGVPAMFSATLPPEPAQSEQRPPLLT